jgi:phosphoglycerate dehydrogenase-like enzyme
VSALTIVSLNTAQRDELFAPVRAIDGVELVHAEHRVSWEEISARRVGRALPEPEPIADDLRATLARADVVFGFVIPRDILALSPRVRWIATPATGIDHLRGTGVLEGTVPVTTVGGLFGSLIAEHVFAVMLAFAKRLPHFATQQRTRTWQMSRVAALEGRTVGLVGVGAIGSAVAVRARAFGMRTLGLGRSDPRGRRVTGVDRLLARDELAALLSESDWVVVAAADTPETRGMIGAAELAAMKPGAVLVNVARGSLIDEAALVAALRAGRIGGAALDVFASEPLPPESPLWELPNLLVTPHIATNVPEYLARAIEQFATNVRRFLAGEPLLNQVDRRRGY